MRNTIDTDSPGRAGSDGGARNLRTAGRGTFGRRGPEPNTVGERLMVDGGRKPGPFPGLGVVRDDEGKHGC